MEKKMFGANADVVRKCCALLTVYLHLPILISQAKATVFSLFLGQFRIHPIESV
jgi:hypothetical protein